MSTIRLARLLRLREEQAKAAKQAWALGERSAVQAAQQLERARAAVRAARAELAAAQETAGAQSGASMGTVLGSHAAIDSLTRRLQGDEARWRDLKLRASELHLEYTKARRDAEALLTLEQRWRTSLRRERRRRDERARDEVIAARAAANARTAR